MLSFIVGAGTTTGYGLDGQGVGFRVSAGTLLSTSFRPILRPTQPPPIQWVPEALSPGGKAARA
jgi:hypothetical protein